ncbi:MAG TPA: tetratricopeptide repeat protein [Armatimonadota bacterium]|jgi:tetratricopeptide (TPR) repeat protein
MHWKKCLFALAVIPILSLAALADPGDDALDAVLLKLKSGDAAGAIADLDKSPSLSPAQTIRARYYRAYAHYRLGQKDTAITDLTGLLPADTASALERAGFVSLAGKNGESARALLGAIHNEAKRYDRLPRIYTAMVEDYAENPEWSYLLAEAFFNAGQYDQAADAFGTFTTMYPDSTRIKDGWLKKEESLRRAGRYEEAYNYLGTIPAKDPDYEIRIAARKAELLSQHFRHSLNLSNQWCEDMIAKYPKEPAIFLCKYRLASNYLYEMPEPERKPAQARQILQGLVRDYPNEPILLEMKVDIAYSFSAQKDYANAIKQYQAILTEHKDNFPADNWHAYVHYCLARCQINKGDKAAGKAVLEAMVTKYPGDNWAALAKENLAEGIR